MRLLIMFRTGGKLEKTQWEKEMVRYGWDVKKTKGSFRIREEGRTGVKCKNHQKQWSAPFRICVEHREEVNEHTQRYS